MQTFQNLEKIRCELVPTMAETWVKNGPRETPLTPDCKETDRNWEPYPRQGVPIHVAPGVPRNLDFGTDACPDPRPAPISLPDHITDPSASGMTGTTAHQQE